MDSQQDPRTMTKAQAIKALAAYGLTNIRPHGRYQILADYGCHKDGLFDPRDILSELQQFGGCDCAGCKAEAADSPFIR